MSREDPQLRIRLPIELKEKIQDLSTRNNRSMNAEIVYILESYINKIQKLENGFEAAELSAKATVQALHDISIALDKIRNKYNEEIKSIDNKAVK